MRGYTVALQDGHVLPGPERIAAEIRFVSALDRALGEPETVTETLLAWQAASESQEDEIDKRTAERTVRWPGAYERRSRGACGPLWAARRHLRTQTGALAMKEKGRSQMAVAHTVVRSVDYEPSLHGGTDPS